MTIATGTYRKGKVILDTPVDWPDGTEVEVKAATEKIGLTEEEWPTTPEGIAELRAQLAQSEPLEMTPEERADFEAWRERVKQYSLEKTREQWRDE